MTDHMTPDEAQDALDRDLDWKAELTAGHRALETIAAMRPEYQYQYPGVDPAVNNELGIWHSLPELAHAYRPFNAWMEGRKPDDERGSVITRYVLDPEINE